MSINPFTKTDPYDLGPFEPFPWNSNMGASYSVAV